ncbi:hypothetical protein MNB_SM-6-996 [hydrothermal vent metagenome]|uniref:Uncharacterized protein n=1 Tax=hydrothermal vent metagenome TaxID=652676 RepID=A0A1W1CEM1_9ZZZZ
MFYLLASLPLDDNNIVTQKNNFRKSVNFFDFFTILSFLATLPQSKTKSLYYNIGKDI